MTVTESATGSEIVVLDAGQPLAFSFDDMLRYSGPGSPGGVALAYKVLERALPLLEAQGPPERREITIDTAFGGPGARDGLELVTRAVTEGGYTVDSAMARPDLGRVRERFVFRLSYRHRTTTLVLRDGVVTEQFIDMAGREGRSEDEEAQLDRLKAELADRVMSASATEVFDVD